MNPGAIEGRMFRRFLLDLVVVLLVVSGALLPSAAARAQAVAEEFAHSATASVPGQPEPSAAPSQTAPARDALPPQLGLDRLLRLPDSFAVAEVRRGGATRSEWQRRFVEARGGIAEARAELARVQERLGNAAGSGGQWQASAPGLGTPDPKTSTVSYKLRQDLRRLRDAEGEAESRLLDLQVRADLAGVPADWYE
jgi:hypothetical protein